MNGQTKILADKDGINICMNQYGVKSTYGRWNWGSRIGRCSLYDSTIETISRKTMRTKRL